MIRNPSATRNDEPAAPDSAQLLISIGGIVGELQFVGAPSVFWEQVRARYSAFTLPGDASVARDFVLHLDTMSVPLPPSPVAAARRLAGAQSHPLSVEARGRRMEASRWDFQIRLDARSAPGKRTVFRGSGRCEMSPFAVDCILRVIYATFLPRVGGMLVHACGLRHAAVGVVFPGQSGAGKTTLARKAADAADVLSDEMVALRRVDGEWRVFGTPFWGDFARGGISIRSWPLRTVGFLSQTDEVRMVPITSSEAILRLLGCLVSFTTDSACIERALALAIQLCAEVRSVEAGSTRAAPALALFRKLAPHLGPDVTRPTPPANVRELISEFRALLRKQSVYTFRPRGGATSWLKAGDSVSVEAAHPAPAFSPGDILLWWVPGATPDDDRLVCDHPSGTTKGELLGRVAVLARDGRALPVTLSQLSPQLSSMVALPVLRMAGR